MIAPTFAPSGNPIRSGSPSVEDTCRPRSTLPRAGQHEHSVGPEEAHRPPSEEDNHAACFAFLSAAQRFLVASPILFLAAALILRRFRGGLGDDCEAALLGGRPRFLIPSIERTLAICSSILVFCRSKPSRAACNSSCEMVM